MATCGAHFFYDNACAGCREAEQAEEAQKEAEREHIRQMEEMRRAAERGETVEAKAAQRTADPECGHFFFDNDCAGCRAKARNKETSRQAERRLREARETADRLNQSRLSTSGPVDDSLPELSTLLWCVLGVVFLLAVITVMPLFPLAGLVAVVVLALDRHAGRRTGWWPAGPDARSRWLRTGLELGVTSTVLYLALFVTSLLHPPFGSLAITVLTLSVAGTAAHAGLRHLRHVRWLHR